MDSTRKVCDPCPTTVTACGEEPGTKGPLSTLYWNCKFAGSVTLSVPLNVKVAVVLFVKAGGPELMVTVGGVVSTVKFQVAPAEILPAPSMACTMKECGPWPSGPMVSGLVAGRTGPLSSWYWKPVMPLPPVVASEPVKVMVGDTTLLYGGVGDVMVVVGLVVSTFQVYVAGAEVLPA